MLLVAIATPAGAAVTATSVRVIPRTIASDGTVGTVDWTNAGDARFESDNIYANVTVDGTVSKYLKATNCGFSIPATATITGIAVTIRRRNGTATNGSTDSAVRLVKADGTFNATSKADTTTEYGTDYATITYGGSADLWGGTWTATDVNDSDFGVGYATTKGSSAGAAHRIDCSLITITVHHTRDVTWDGGAGAGTTTWSTGANWVGDVAPTAGRALIFAGSTSTTNVNNIADGTAFSAIAFTTGGFSLSGTAFAVSSAYGIDNRVGSNAVANALTLGSAATFAAASGTTLTVSGTIANGSHLLTTAATGAIALGGAIGGGAGGMWKTGSGTTTLSGANTYGGSTTIANGTLRLSGGTAIPDAGAVLVSSNAAEDTVWFDDALPAGSTTDVTNDSWTWVAASPAPYSGTLAHQSANVAGHHQHYFYGATATMTIPTGARLFQYVYLDPASPPTQVMLQWRTTDGDWDHRAYWGANSVTTPGFTYDAARRHMGNLPATGQWVRLEVPASLLGLEGATMDGQAYTLVDGRVTWDRSGYTLLGQNAHLLFSADDNHELYVNGSLLGTVAASYLGATTYALNLDHGTNTIAVKAVNTGGPGFIYGELNVDGVRSGTDTTWKIGTTNPAGWTTAGYDDSAWANATDFGTPGYAIAGIASDTPAKTIWTASGSLTDLTVYARKTITLAGALELDGASETIGSLAGRGGVTLGSWTLTVGGTTSTTFSGAIAGTGGLTRGGTGTTTLSGVSTYTGATTVTGGTLRLSGSGRLADTTAIVLADAAGAAFDLNGVTDTVGSIAGGGATGGTIALGAGSLTCGGSNASTTMAGVISGAGGTLTKVGSGTLIVTGTNTYTGTTTVSAGTLQVDGAQSGSAVAVAGGTLADGQHPRRRHHDRRHPLRPPRARRRRADARRRVDAAGRSRRLQRRGHHQRDHLRQRQRHVRDGELRQRVGRDADRRLYGLVRRPDVQRRVAAPPWQRRCRRAVVVLSWTRARGALVVEDAPVAAIARGFDSSGSGVSIGGSAPSSAPTRTPGAPAAAPADPRAPRR
ncbi:MAG TPA: autotransporter-associated beta strand repeat-containing protein [Planctomycetota bacterium]|nr:autotransporter-associated beta strand repeat-containing protein [Planctomycetota bacterium]